MNTPLRKGATVISGPGLWVEDQYRSLLKRTERCEFHPKGVRIPQMCAGSGSEAALGWVLSISSVRVPKLVLRCYQQDLQRSVDGGRTEGCHVWHTRC